MAETMTLKQFSENLQTLVNTDENVAALTMPIDFQDVSADTLQIVNEYETYLTNNDYENAYNLRKNNPVLETLILDATKLNYLQTLMLTSYEFAKGEKSAANMSYDNNTSGLTGETVQTAIDEICDEIGMGSKSEGSLSERIENLETELNNLELTADNVSFNNTNSDIDSLNVQGAIEELASTVSATSIRFNENNGEGVIQVYKNGIWIDFMNFSGIILSSSGGTTIFKAGDTSIGKGITGGWSSSNYKTAKTSSSTISSTTNNFISLTGVTSIQVQGGFTSLYNDASGGKGSLSSSAYVGVQVLDSTGTIVKKRTVYASSSTSVTFTLDISDLEEGMYQIKYIAYGWYKSTPQSAEDSNGVMQYWNMETGTQSTIKNISLYATS